MLRLRGKWGIEAVGSLLRLVLHSHDALGVSFVALQSLHSDTHSHSHSQSLSFLALNRRDAIPFWQTASFYLPFMMRTRQVRAWLLYQSFCRTWRFSYSLT